MTQKRKRYDKQFKIAAARVVLGGEMRAVDLARELGIKDSTLRRWAQEHGEMGDPRVNLVDRAFVVEARNKLWVGDITCIGTGEGRPCLAAVIDAFRRKVVGWSMSGAHDREAGRGCARAGSRKGEPARRLQPRLSRRPGFLVRVPGVAALPRVPWDRPIHVAAVQPVGRRARGILL